MDNACKKGKLLKDQLRPLENCITKFTDSDLFLSDCLENRVMRNRSLPRSDLSDYISILDLGQLAIGAIKWIINRLFPPNQGPRDRPRVTGSLGLQRRQPIPKSLEQVRPGRSVRMSVGSSSTLPAYLSATLAKHYKLHSTHLLGRLFYQLLRVTAQHASSTDDIIQQNPRWRWTSMLMAHSLRAVHYAMPSP